MSSEVKYARAHVIVKGRVQGVAFRYETRRMAGRYRVTGWVKNRRDGSVEAVFEGPAGDVRAAVDWIKQGPRFARVSDAEVTMADFKGEYSAFDIVF